MNYTYKCPKCGTRPDKVNDQGLNSWNLQTYEFACPNPQCGVISCYVYESGKVKL